MEGVCARERILGEPSLACFLGVGDGIILTGRKAPLLSLSYIKLLTKNQGSQSYIKSIYPRPRVPPAFGTPAPPARMRKNPYTTIFFSNKLLSITAAPHRPGRHMRQAAHWHMSEHGRMTGNMDLPTTPGRRQCAKSCGCLPYVEFNQEWLFFFNAHDVVLLGLKYLKLHWKFMGSFY